jgi:16S rRNA (cytosine1402-N4)-methyltransferase
VKTERDGDIPAAGAEPTPHRRRPRYPGKNPRRFEHKYKELRAGDYPEAAAHIESRGKTVAGTHRPILVSEILSVLEPGPGQRVVDCTLGHGGHALALLERVGAGVDGGGVLGLDVDPLELPRAEARIRAAGYGPDRFRAVHSNFAGMGKVLAESGWGDGVDVILADLGVSSMQIDDPQRGFTFKQDGPLDLRLNPMRGVAASAWLAGVKVQRLEEALRGHSDEPRARELALALVAAREREAFVRTVQLADWIRRWAGVGVARDEVERIIRRVFQAMRVAVNDEFSALDMWLRQLPDCLRSGGRVAVLTFHSGEDRRVKRAFRAGLESGVYAEAPEAVIRPGAEEQRANPRSSPAKLRWARRA